MAGRPGVYWSNSFRENLFLVSSSDTISGSLPIFIDRGAHRTVGWNTLKG